MFTKVRPCICYGSAPWGAKICINLRLLCRNAEMSISDYVWDSISPSIIEISWRYLEVPIRAKYSIQSWHFSPTASTVRAVAGAKMCRNLLLLCRYAERSISDYVLDSISPSIIEISWRYLAVPIRAKCSIRIWKFSLASSTVRTEECAKVWVWCDFRLTSRISGELVTQQERPQRSIQFLTSSVYGR